MLQLAGCYGRKDAACIDDFAMSLDSRLAGPQDLGPGLVFGCRACVPNLPALLARCLALAHVDGRIFDQQAFSSAQRHPV